MFLRYPDPPRWSSVLSARERRVLLHRDFAPIVADAIGAFLCVVAGAGLLASLAALGAAVAGVLS